MDNSYSSIVVNKQFYEYNNNSFSQTKSIKIKISNTYSQKNCINHEKMSTLFYKHVNHKTISNYNVKNYPKSCICRYN